MIKLKDIIKESKRLNLFEQEAINLPPVNFDKAFVNNYTEIEPGSWEKTANQLIATLKDYRDNKNYDITKLEIDIQGGSSDAAASNIWDDSKKQNPPKHTFGNDPDFTSWVRKSDNTLALNNQPIPDGRSGAGVNIGTDGIRGNKWLANDRAKALQAVLIPYIEKALGEKMKSKIVASAEDRRFANAQIRSAVTPENPSILPPPDSYTLGSGTRQMGIDTTKMWPNHSTNSQYNKWRQNPDSAKEMLKQFGIRLFPLSNNDLGAGPGKPIVLTKALLSALAKRGDKKATRPGFINKYGGDWRDYEIEQWIIKSQGGKDPKTSNFKWRYVDAETGLPKKLYSNYEFTGVPLSTPIGKIDYETLLQ